MVILDYLNAGRQRYAKLNPNQSSAIAEAFWYASSSLTDLTVMVKSIADSITTQIRTAANNTNPYYAPTVSVPVTVVRVRRPWLAYPLALVLAGLVFLALTMYATSRRNVRPGKGHRMPLLLADIDETLRARAQGGTGTPDGARRSVGRGACAARIRRH